MEHAISRKSQLQCFPPCQGTSCVKRMKQIGSPCVVFWLKICPAQKQTVDFASYWSSSFRIRSQDSYFIACSISHLNHHRIKTNNISLNSAPPNWYTSLFGTKSGRLENVRRNIMNSKISTNKGGGWTTCFDNKNRLKLTSFEWTTWINSTEQSPPTSFPQLILSYSKSKKIHITIHKMLQTLPVLTIGAKLFVSQCLESHCHWQLCGLTEEVMGSESWPRSRPGTRGEDKFSLKNHGMENQKKRDIFLENLAYGQSYLRMPFPSAIMNIPNNIMP